MKRQVALMPEAVAADAERLARFQREAEVLASMNQSEHRRDPRPAGIGRREGACLELIEGETLSEVIARGPLPLTDALTIATQIADALEAAHGKCIVQRDRNPRTSR